MYLPLAAVAALVVVAAYAGLRRLADRHWLSRPSARGASEFFCRGVGHRGGTRRGHLRITGTYGDAVGLWCDTLDKVPVNARAQNNLGVRCRPGASWTRRW